MTSKINLSTSWVQITTSKGCLIQKLDNPDVLLAYGVSIPTDDSLAHTLNTKEVQYFPQTIEHIYARAVSLPVAVSVTELTNV